MPPEILYLFVEYFKNTSPPYCGDVPADRFIRPVKPDTLFFFVTMFIMPAVPSGSNFADGFVITSIFLIKLVGI